MNQSTTPLRLGRRQFLGAAVAASAPLILPSRLFGANAPSRTLNVAICGGGTRFHAHLHSFSNIPGVRVVAACEVNEPRRKAAKKAIDSKNGDSSAKVYHDYREMIAESDADIITVATPDHWHALMAIEAANAGKHLYLDKPFSFTVQEGQAIVAAVKRNGIILQHGTQQRSQSSFQRATFLARSGRLGEIEKVYAISPNGPIGGDPAPVAPPAGLDFDFFTGPAPQVPHVAGLSDRPGTPGWYFLSAFSGGWVTAWGSHHVDCAQWALGKDHEAPVKVEVEGKYPETGAWDTATEWYAELTYGDGKKLIYLTANRPECPKAGGNVCIVGSEGWAMATRGKCITNPPHLGAIALPKNDPEFQLVERGGDAYHFLNLIDAIRHGERLRAPAEIGHLSTTLCHLTNIGIETQRPLHWDGKTEQFIGDAQANRMLSRPMRAPWKLST